MLARSSSDNFAFGYGYETGLVLVRQLSTHFDIDGRLLFQKCKVNNEVTASEVIDPIFTKNGKMKYIDSYSYLSLPITARYKLMDKNGNMKMMTLEELKDKHPGKVGTPERDDYEFELKVDIPGKMIKTVRKERHLTQEQLGKLVGVNKSQISKPERNTKTLP